MNEETAKSVLHSQGGHLTFQDFEKQDDLLIQEHLNVCPICKKQAEAYNEGQRKWSDPARLAAFDQRMKETFERLRRDPEPIGGPSPQPSSQIIVFPAKVIEAVRELGEKATKEWNAYWAYEETRPKAASTHDNCLLSYSTDDGGLIGEMEIQCDAAAKMTGAKVTAKAWSPDYENAEVEVILKCDPHPFVTLHRDADGAFSGTVFVPKEILPDGNGRITFQLRKRV
jgi:hypothetical protein